MVLRPRSRVAFAICASIVAGCSFLTSWDDYVSGGVLVDASDAPSEVGNAVDDAEADASVDAYVSPLECSDATYCEDFERPDASGAWDIQSVTVGSGFTIGSAIAHSGSSSLQISLGTIQASRAFISRTFPPVSRLKAREFVYLPEGVNRERDVFQLRFIYAARQTSVNIVAAPNHIVVGEQEIFHDGGGLNQNISAVYDIHALTNRWVAIEVEVDNAADPPVLSFTIDGISVLERAPLMRTYGKGSAAVLLGTTNSTAGPPTTFRIDDVRVDSVP